MYTAQLTEGIKTNHVLIYSEFHILEKRPLSLVNEPDLGYDVIKISSFRAGSFGRTSTISFPFLVEGNRLLEISAVLSGHPCFFEEFAREKDYTWSDKTSRQF